MGTLSPLLIASSALLCLGNLLHIIGLATRHWIYYTTGEVHVHAGLWEACSHKMCINLDGDPLKIFWDEYKDDVGALRAMIILGMLCGLAGAAVAVLMVVFAIFDKAVHSMMPLIGMLASVVAFVFIIIGVIIYVAKLYADSRTDLSDVGYSFALCIVGGILIPIGGALLKASGRAMASLSVSTCM